MEIKDLNIVMLAFQPSVVARGLEKKLVELGNNVKSVIGDITDIEDILTSTDLFILNLPTKISDDTDEIKMLVKLGNTILANERRLILVGEREVWSELVKIYKSVSQFVWVYRPVEIHQLTEAIEKAFASKPKPKGGNRILIVDDDPDYAKMVRGWIKDSYKVDIVTAGMKAISFLLKVPDDDKVNLILLDYEMPIVDGPQVLQMLRQEPATADIPVVFLTGRGDRESVAKVVSLKPDGYILKSTTRDDLLSFICGKLKKHYS